MKKLIAIVLTAVILILSGCQEADPIVECQSDPPISTSVSQTDPEDTEIDPVFNEESSEFRPSESISQTDPTQGTTPKPSAPERPEGIMPSGTTPPAGNGDSDKPSDPTEGTAPPQTQPTVPDPTVPSVPQETDPPVTQSPETEPAQSEPNPTEPEPTESAATEITYEFKRQIAAYAVQYINAYRGSPCTVLSGMSQVAQYRASQLTWNYGHSTADKRAALAYYEYGRFIDATEFGDDASNSYWEADSAEAICAGFYGTDPDAMGKKIADLIRNSSGHWSYISSSEYSYIGVGVEYREGSEYGWYACVMVGSVDYG